MEHQQPILRNATGNRITIHKIVLRYVGKACPDGGAVDAAHMEVFVVAKVGEVFQRQLKCVDRFVWPYRSELVQASSTQSLNGGALRYTS